MDIEVILFSSLVKYSQIIVRRQGVLMPNAIILYLSPNIKLCTMDSMLCNLEIRKIKNITLVTRTCLG